MTTQLGNLIPTDLSVDGGTDEDSNGVGPGNGLVLIPPPGHHNGDIETEYERQRDEITVGLTVVHHAFENPE
jgi:hypothetical protein